MDKWILLRGGIKYGPYNNDQLLSMSKNNQIIKDDLFWKDGLENWIGYSEAFPMWKGNIPVKKDKKKKRKLPKVIAAVIAVSIVAVAVFAVFFTGTQSDVIVTGRGNTLAGDRLGENGGTIVYDSPGNFLDGLTLKIPEGAYEKNRNVRIIASEIKSDSLPPIADTASPLITVTGLHDYSLKPMELTIPVNISEDEFAMGFFYDRKTGALEGIPFTEITGESITLLTKHFSDVVILRAKTQSLYELNVTTAFSPGADDWQFVNVGTFIAPRGHCAGQAITAMFYHSEVHLKKDEPKLFGRFDNNDYGIRTPDFWIDDSWGMRFSSVVQRSITFTSELSSLLRMLGNVDDSFSMLGLTFSMYMTGEPQYLAVARIEQLPGGGTRRYGHAIVAYAVRDNRVYVADPNFPGQRERYIRFGSDRKFLPYGSGASATDIQANGLTAYDIFNYVAKTALVDYTTVNRHYQEMLSGSSGEGLYPETEVIYLESTDPDTGEEVWTDMPQILHLSVNDTLRNGEENRGRVLIGFATTSESDIYMEAYTGLSPPVRSVSGTGDSTRYIVANIELEKEINHIGARIENEVPGQGFRFIDFLRYRVIYDQATELRFEKEEYRVIPLRKDEFKVIPEDEPADHYYLWDFGDGSEIIETDVPYAEYAYEDPGIYEMNVELRNNEDDSVFAVAVAYAEAIDIKGKWDMEFTITSASRANRILTAIHNAIGRSIYEALGLSGSPEREDIEMEGSVHRYILNVDISPDMEEYTGTAVMTFVSSSHPVIDFEDFTTGTINIDGDHVVITFLPYDEDWDKPIVFRGRLSENSDYIHGSFSADIMSGNFSAGKHD